MNIRKTKMYKECNLNIKQHRVEIHIIFSISFLKLVVLLNPLFSSSQMVPKNLTATTVLNCDLCTILRSWILLPISSEKKASFVSILSGTQVTICDL